MHFCQVCNKKEGRKVIIDFSKKGSHKCPVCGKYEFPEFDSFDVCPVCGWEDDWIQEDDPDFGGANWETLNGCKALYKAGKHKNSDEEKRRWLNEQGFFKNQGA